jgi:hypothetical protein
MFGVEERASDLDLAQEPIGAQRGGELRVQHLDRDVAVVGHVVRQVHDRHSTLSQLSLEAVLLRELTAKGRQGLRRDRRLGHAEPLKKSICAAGSSPPRNSELCELEYI